MVLTEEWPESSIDVTDNLLELTSHLSGGKYDITFPTTPLGSFTGLDALRIAQEKSPNTPFIFLSGTIGEDRAIEALRAGAKDYVLKDRMKRLVTAIHRALQDAEDQRNREEADRRLRKQAEALDKARDAIIITDLEGFVESWNRGAERIIGLVPEGAIGRQRKRCWAPGSLRRTTKGREGLGEGRRLAGRTAFGRPERQTPRHRARHHTHPK